MYGIVWSKILGINIDLDNQYLIKQILNEKKYLLTTQYGLQFAFPIFLDNHTYHCQNGSDRGNFNDWDTWEASSIDHSLTQQKKIQKQTNKQTHNVRKIHYVFVKVMFSKYYNL